MVHNPLPVLMDSSNEGLVSDALPRLAVEGMEELDRAYNTGTLEQFSKPTLNWGLSVLLSV